MIFWVTSTNPLSMVASRFSSGELLLSSPLLTPSPLCTIPMKAVHPLKSHVGAFAENKKDNFVGMTLHPDTR